MSPAGGSSADKQPAGTIDGPKSSKRPSFLTDLRDTKKHKLVHTTKKSTVKGIDPADIQDISADQLRDSSWTENHVHVVSGLSIPNSTNTSQGEDAETTKQQQKKHQINWLAMETKQKEAHLLEKSAVGKQKQRSTALKYGW
jgi:hypothetical protein